MLHSERLRLDPIPWMKKFGIPTEHVTYDPKMRKGDYSIIRQSTHDGTMAFSYELMGKVLELIGYKASYYKPREAEFNAAKDVKYTVGPLKVAVVFGRVRLPCSETQLYPGQRERVRLPVRVEYIG